MLDISDTTGETYYSGTSAKVVDFLRVLNIGEGKADRIGFDTVNRYQEMVDRSIDEILGGLYYVPLRQYNQVRPTADKNGLQVVQRVFPGELSRISRVWTAALILQSEFQQLESNLTDQVTAMIEDAKKGIYALSKPTHWLPGQRRKSNISHTIDGHFQPAALPELNV